MTPGIDYIGVGCGALIINENNEVLLVKRGEESRNEAGIWAEPGGRVEFNEKVEDAIKREIKEELNINIQLLDFLGFVNHIVISEKQHWVSFSYSAKIVKGELKNMEPEKIEEIRWFKLDRIPENLSPSTQEPIKNYLKLLRQNK